MANFSSLPPITVINYDSELFSSQGRTSLSQYPECKISMLQAGPIQTTFTGLIVNLQNYTSDINTLAGAKGCVKMILRDETGEILVNLWFTKTTTFKLFLNAEVTVWTTHICAASWSSTPAKSKSISAPICTNLFPERNNNCGLKIRPRDSWKFNFDAEIKSLISLEEFMSGKHDDSRSVTLLVCIRSLGGSVSVTKPSTQETFMAASLLVADASTPDEAIRLALEEPLFESFSHLDVHPENPTVLMLTNPRFIKGKLMVPSRQSRLFLEPSIQPADNLRAFFLRRSPRCHAELDKSTLNALFSQQDSVPIPKLSLSEMDAVVSQNPTKMRKALVTVLISHMSFASLFTKHQLLYTYCKGCSLSQHSNSFYAQCSHLVCKTQDAILRARANPHIIGAFCDETCGYFCSPTTQISSSNTQSSSLSSEEFKQEPLAHPLLITDQAFNSLVGRTTKDLADHIRSLSEGDAVSEMRQLDKRLEWSRVEFLLGWTGDSVSPCYCSGPPRKGSGDKETIDWKRYGQLVLLDVKIPFPRSNSSSASESYRGSQ